MQTVVCLTWELSSFFAVLYKISLGWFTVYKNKYQVGYEEVELTPTQIYFWGRGDMGPTHLFCPAA